MNKLFLLILIFLIFNNCSLDKKKSFFNKKKPNVKKIENIKTILTKQLSSEVELNPSLEIKISIGEFNKNFRNNQNDMGQLFYDGSVKKVGKYKFSKFDNFINTDMQPVFYNENIIFFDNKGTIIFSDKNQKIIWKKNFYNKSEKKK